MLHLHSGRRLLILDVLDVFLLHCYQLPDYAAGGNLEGLVGAVEAAEEYPARGVMAAILQQDFGEIASAISLSLPDDPTEDEAVAQVVRQLQEG